jgi:two-component sensor histidine kinase
MRKRSPRSIRWRVTSLLGAMLLPVVAALMAAGWFVGGGLATTMLLIEPVLFGVIALFLVWLLLDRQIAKPLNRLAAASTYGKSEPGLEPVAIPSRELDAVSATMADMAERIAAREQELKDAVETRGALLREIHHRVKNNLQIVTSLLNLQAKSVQGEDARRAFDDIQTRVRALALVHRYLYESDDVQSVNLGAFLKELAASLQLAYGAANDQVSIEIDAETVWDIVDRAVPLALFITEAMTNALKHAFPQGRRGIIRVVLKALPDSVIRFSVEDNGIGFSEPQTAPRGPQAGPGQAGLGQSPGSGQSNSGQPGLGHSSLGMSLIKAFARQVGGKLTISGPPGTIVMIEFVRRLPVAGSPSNW